MTSREKRHLLALIGCMLLLIAAPVTLWLGFYAASAFNSLWVLTIPLSLNIILAFSLGRYSERLV